MSALDLAPTPVRPTAADFRSAMSLLAAGVNVVTTAGPAGLAGFTASAVCSVTDAPPTVLVCMNRQSYAHPLFVANRSVCVNVLAASQRAVSDLFANREVAMADRFARCPHRTLVTGAPALLGAAAQLDGVIVATHDIGSHSVFIVELQGLASGDEAAAAGGLVYFGRQFHPVACA